MVIGVGMVGVVITGEALTPTTEDAELWSRIGLTGLVIMSLYESVFATKERHARSTGLDLLGARFLLNGIVSWRRSGKFHRNRRTRSVVAMSAIGT
jgi:hypothetical protein